MAGILPKRHSMESDDGSDPELSDVFIGPITKEEIRAHMKTKKKNVSVTTYPKAPVGTPRVIDHINLVTPVKGSGRNDPLDLSMRKTTPMVVDISTPTASQTITLPDTPRYTSILNESDFMDESDIGISVDSVIVDLSRDIEAEMENDLKEIEKNRALSNQSLHLQSFFNNATHLNITNTDTLSVQTRKDNLDTTMNGTHGNFNNTQTMNDIHQMDCSQKTSNSMNQEQNASGMHLNLTENNHSTITRNTEILNASNTLKDNKSQILNNTSHNRSTSLSHSVSYVHNESSQLASEVSSVWSGGEEQSFGKESDDSKNQDVLSESFQYYPGRATDKENDLNQSNQVPSILIKYEDESHLNETFEKLSMRHSKSGSDPNAPPNAAEDTLEEIDILEKYGYKTAHTDNIIIPTINILSATIIEESFDEKEADHNTSEALMDVSSIPCKENIDQDPLEHSGADSGQNIEHDPLEESFDGCEQNMDHSLNKSEQNIDHSLNKSEQNIDHSLNKSEQNMAHYLNKSEQNMDHSLNKSEQNMDHSLNKSKQNMDHSLNKSKQNMDHSLDKSRENMDHSLNKSEQNMDHSLNKSKQNMDHSLNKSKQNLNDSVIKSKHNMDNSLNKSKQNMDNSLNKSEQNMDNSLNKSEQNMDHSLNKSIENMGHSLTKSKQNLNDSLIKSKHNMDNSLNKSKQNMNHSLNKSKQNLNDSVIKSKHNMDNSLNKSKQNMDHSLNKSKQNMHNSLNKSQQSMDHSLNKSEQSTDHSLNKSKQNMHNSLNKSQQSMDHSLNKSEQNMDHSLNKSKQNMDHSLNKSKHNMDHSLNKSEQNMDHSLNKSEQSTDHSLNKSKQNMDHSLNKSKHNMDHSLNKSEQNMNHSLNKSKHNMDHSLNKSEQNMDHSLNKSKHNMVHSLNKSKQNLNHSLNKYKQNMDHSLNKSKHNMDHSLNKSEQNTDQSLNKSKHVIDKDTLEVSLNNPAINADVLQPSSSENSECLPEIKDKANKSLCEPEDKSVPSLCAAPSADSLSSSVRPTEEIEQNDTNIHEVSQMLADTSIQTKKNVTMETSTLNKSCVHIMSRDSCVGLYETVNEVGASGLLSACPELEEEDDLDHSIIDNSDATNYWKEVNSANNTAYIELSPIKKNASTEITVEGVQSDHTYAHGEACSIQSNFADASSSVQVVQYIYANTSKELLKSIVEENEPHKDESNEIEMVLTETEKDVKVPADVSMTQTEGNRNVSQKENKDISHNASSEQVGQFVGDLGDVSMKTEDVISVSGNSSTFQAEVSDPLNKTFDEGDVELVAEIDANVEPSDNEKRTSQTPSAGERNEPDESKGDMSVKIVEQMKEENINVVTNDRRAAEVSTKNEMENSIAAQLAVSNEQDVANVKDSTGLIIDVSGLKESMMNGVCVVQEEDKSEINNASMKQLGAQTEKKNESVNNNTAQDTFEHKTLDECDFRSLAEKYGGDNTGVSLCTTTELSSFNQEIFMKPRQLDDNLNVSSPDLESSKRDLKKAASKPISQIPMSKRPNVLRPTKFSNDNIKMSSKPLLKVKSAENSMIKPMNGSTHKVQKENVPSPKVKNTSAVHKENVSSPRVKNTSAVHKENVSSPRVKATLATPLTPARSISQSLVSTISSFANKITGRTPRKESNNPAKLKSPEHTSCLKSPKPTSGVAHSSKFTPMLAKFKTQPSSTPAVKSTASNAPTPRHKSSNTPTPRHKTPHEATVRKSLSTSKLEGQHKTPSKLNLSGSRKLDFKNVESKIGSIRKPSELPLLQKVVKSPKPSLIKPPKFTGSKLPSMITAAGPVKRTSKFLNVLSPIGAYIRDGTKATSDNKKDGSFIPRKLMRLNQSETPQSGKLVATENTFGNGGNSTVSADVSMGESCILVNQEINASNVMKHSAL